MKKSFFRPAGSRLAPEESLEDQQEGLPWLTPIALTLRGVSAPAAGSTSRGPLTPPRRGRGALIDALPGARHAVLLISVSYVRVTRRGRSCGPSSLACGASSASRWRNTRSLRLPRAGCAPSAGNPSGG